MITVLFLSNSGGETNGAAQSLFDLIESVKEVVKPIVFIKSQGDVYDFFVSHGIECYVCTPSIVLGYKRSWFHYLFHPWHLRFIKNYRQVRTMVRLVKDKISVNKIDIIHTNTSTVCSGYFLSRVLKTKHIWHIRENLDLRYLPGELIYSWSRIKQMMNKADARIVISNPCCQHWGLKENNTWMIWDAVRSVKDCCYIKTKQPYILFCSQCITEAKGASRAVTAFGLSGLFASHVDANVTIRLKMIGNCPEDYKSNLLAIADGFGCAGFIDFIPAQKDVKPYFAHALAFVNPSVNEGLGRTTAEAMFFGCPVIAYASGGTLDLVKEGETGYLFNTVEECSELLRKVCTSEQEEIILRAQEFAKQNLSIENYGKKIMAVYNSVLKTK